MQIRPARATDIDSILAMQHQIHAEHLAWDAARWTTAMSVESAYREWLRRLVLNTSDGIVLTAELDGRIAGYLIAEAEDESTKHWSPAAVYLHDLFVDSRERRAGIARRLIDQLLAWSDEEHPTLQVRLITAARNEAARTFFERVGFRPSAVEMLREPAK